jgi:nitroimidazol reductase NimA-like FMN-containing flavoprotein (pyridoxamine 5'-phosphate oxidase superfamily)
MSEPEIAAALAGPWQAVLSVNRRDRGPLAVPMSYLFEEGEFWMITPRDSLHGRLMQASGRSTMTVHHDEVTPRSVEQWYVIAEGTIRFTDDDPEPLLRKIMVKDRGPGHAEEWVRQSLPNVTTVAVLSPERLSGYHGVSQLD